MDRLVTLPRSGDILAHMDRDTDRQAKLVVEVIETLPVRKCHLGCRGRSDCEADCSDVC